MYGLGVSNFILLSLNIFSVNLWVNLCCKLKLPLFTMMTSGCVKYAGAMAPQTHWLSSISQQIIWMYFQSILWRHHTSLQIASLFMTFGCECQLWVWSTQWGLLGSLDESIIARWQVPLLVLAWWKTKNWLGIRIPQCPAYFQSYVIWTVLLVIRVFVGT